MLVLSRRPNEDVYFPHLGIRVRVLRTMGNRVQLGIQAPDSVQITRGTPADLLPGTPACRKREHQLRNELHAVRLVLEMYERQLNAGDLDAANRTFLQLLTRLQSADAAQAAPSTAVVENSAGPRVLVVEDDDNERELLAGLLRMDGCCVSTAEDGAAALELLMQGPQLPDVMLLDMHMPRLDGRATVSAIRNHERLRPLVVFAVSGSTPDHCGVTVGDQQGVDEWFAKPLNPGLLVSLMRQRLKADALVSA